MKVRLHTLGCKVNQYETEAMTEDLIKNGFELSLSDDDADVFIVNSCTVTSESDRKTRQTVRRLKNRNPGSIVVLTGCMPQAFPDMAAQLPEADIVLGNKNNQELVPSIKAFIQSRERLVAIEQHAAGESFFCAPIHAFNERTRAILKIEDGCDRFCSYCIIPKARGRVRSKPLDVIRAEAQALADAGFCELVLVGINLSAFGKDTGDTLGAAIGAASEPAGIRRVRLGSLEPDHLTDEMLASLSKESKLCPQFHISLQSGCNSVLRRMNRHYTAEEYLSLCEKLRKTFRDCTLTTDIMVGFPAESHEDFLETVDFAKKAAFEKIHIFPYSVRSGTKAAGMMPQVDRHTKEKRVSLLAIEAARMRERFLAAQVGKEVEIVAESKTEGQYVFGYTANYTPVLAVLPADKLGESVRVRITGSDADFCYAD